MAGRRHDPAAFRPDPSATQSLAPSRRQATAMIAVLVLVAGAVAVASFAVKSNKAQAFKLFYGSVFLNDERAPVAVDLTNGKPTVRLVDANTQVSAKRPSDLDVVALTNGTLLLDTATGEFNMVDPAGFVVKTKNGGVPLPKRTGPTDSVGISAGASAYILQTGRSGTSVYLVGQSTVQSATGPGAKVRPRAFATMTEPSSIAPGTSASANGDLWVLVGDGASRTVRQLSVPRGSDAGVTLHSTDRGAVPAVSSIGVTSGRTGGDVVAVGAPGQVEVFDGAAKPRTDAVKGLVDVDRILPSSNQTGGLSFLYHSTVGWSLVSVPAGNGALAGPMTLHGIDATAQLAAPAASDGKLFTIDTGSSGRVWQIGPHGAVRSPTGAATYPVVHDASGKAVEVADFSDTYVLARGARVVFDSPSHVQGLALFTDGSHPPVRIDKSAAVSLNAAGDATALTDAHTPKNPNAANPPAKSTLRQPPAQPINDKIRCQSTVQVPHIPTITQATPGSRSVQLQWAYPLLDPRDCAPSTYTVSVKLLSASAPSPPASVTVQGEDAVDLAGLFPSTQYEISVTAFLHGRGTKSVPVRITTGPEGPAAPTNVHAGPDSSGNWTITWNSCGGVAQGCVPSSTWNVIPNFCDAAGLSSPPATVSVAGDPSQHTFRATFPGSNALLGRGLSFQVEGIGNQGAVGTPGRGGGCTYSWTPPVAEDISVVASSPPETTGQATSTTKVAVSFAGGQVHDLGGIGGQLTYRLITGGQVGQHVGPTTATTATLGGLQPGQTYQVSVVASPPRHPEAAVTLPPASVDPAVAAWPVLSLTTSFANTSFADGTLSVQINGLTSADARGETFDLADSNLVCGGGDTAHSLERSDFDPANALVFTGIQRQDYNGDCTVIVHLAQHSGTVYGAGASPAASAPISIEPPSLTAGGGDFSAAWSDQSSRGDPQIVVGYDNADPLLLSFANNWSLVVSNGTTANCGSSSSAPTTTVHVDKACVQAGGTFTVTVAFTYFGSPHSYLVGVTGTAPAPIDSTKISFTAAWGGTDGGGNPQVNITTTSSYSQQTLGSLNWSEAVAASTTPGATCGSSSQTPTTAATIGVSVARTTCPPESGTTTTWTVTIHYADPSTGDSHTYSPITVSGTEP